jgi:hypothetical protein
MSAASRVPMPQNAAGTNPAKIANGTRCKVCAIVASTPQQTRNRCNCVNCTHQETSVSATKGSNTDEPRRRAIQPCTRANTAANAPMAAKLQVASMRANRPRPMEISSIPTSLSFSTIARIAASLPRPGGTFGNIAALEKSPSLAGTTIFKADATRISRVASTRLMCVMGRTKTFHRHAEISVCGMNNKTATAKYVRSTSRACCKTARQSAARSNSTHNRIVIAIFAAKIRRFRTRRFLAAVELFEATPTRLSVEQFRRAAIG